MRYYVHFVCIALITLLISCSSVPNTPAEITNIRGIGKTQLQLANYESDRGNYEAALGYLDDAWGYAARSDDPELRIKVRLSRGNIYLYQDQAADARREWNAALAEAEQEGMAELASAAKIHIARGQLLEAINNKTADAALIENTETVLRKEMSSISNEKLYLAMAWASMGLAEKEQGLWDKAEASLKNALAIHESGNYLEQAAYDWYLIASIRSVAGKYSIATDALTQAIAFDRRAENTYGLGYDWTALGDVYHKTGELEKAENAYLRAIDIFTAASMEREIDMVIQKRERFP